MQEVESGRTAYLIHEKEDLKKELSKVKKEAQAELQSVSTSLSFNIYMP